MSEPIYKIEEIVSIGQACLLIDDIIAGLVFPDKDYLDFDDTTFAKHHFVNAWRHLDIAMQELRLAEAHADQERSSRKATETPRKKESRICTSYAEAKSALEHIGLPAIIYPMTHAGTSECIKCVAETTQQYFEGVEGMLKASPDRTILIETKV